MWVVNRYCSLWGIQRPQLCSLNKMFLLQFEISSKVTLSKLDDEIIQFNCLHRFTLRGLCQESKIDSHFIGNFQHFIAGKKRFVSYLCVLFYKTLLYVCVCIKGFMFPYNNILVSSRPKSTLHIFSKIKIDSQEKFAHYCFHQAECAAASSCLNFDLDTKICNSGSCCDCCVQNILEKCQQWSLPVTV